MTNRNLFLTVAFVIVATTIIAIATDQLYGMRAMQVTGDFRNAVLAEVRDAQGQMLLHGSFAPVDADDEGEVERLARLTPVTAGGNASGEAEVEYQSDNPALQEIELTANGLAAGVTVSLVIDGTTVTTAKADNKGKVEVELEVKSAAAQ